MSLTKATFYNIYNSFKLSSEKISNQQFLLYIFTAYIFGMLVRLIALFQALQIDAFWQDGLPVAIWTPDAGRYGYYAEVLLNGGTLPLSADYLTGHLVAGISYVLNIPLEWVMLILPIVIAPLIVVPIMIIAKSIKQCTLGFLSVLVIVSETYFYMRSYLGYMDTDGINLLLILFAISFIVKAVLEKQLWYATLAAVCLELFALWYHSSAIINLLIVGVTFMTVLLYYRKNLVAIQSIFLLGIAIIPLPLGLKLVALVLLTIIFLLLNKYKDYPTRIYFVILVIVMIIVSLYINPEYYFHRALSYLSPETLKQFSGNGINYFYDNDLLTVGEVKGSNLWNVGAPLLVSDIYILVGIVGYMLLSFIYPPMLFLAPLFILGLLSSWGGSRFSMYATPALAFGAVFVLYGLREWLSKNVRLSVYINRLPFYAVTLIVLLMIYNIFMINPSIMLRANLYAPEVKVLKEISKDMTTKDTIISWWDYGWPLWYYTGYDNTLVDNGKHGGPDSYIIARMLLSTDQKYTYNAANILAEARLKTKNMDYEFLLPYLGKEHNLTALFSSKLSEQHLSVKKSDDSIYIMLHRGMLDYFATLNNFSKKKLTGGILGPNPSMRITNLVKPFSPTYSLLEGHAYILDSSDGKVLDAYGKKTPVSGLTIVENNTRTQGYAFTHKVDKAEGHVIAYRDKFIWLDQVLYDSFFIQALLFDVYDKNLFEKVGETTRIKIFKLKK